MTLTAWRRLARQPLWLRLALVLLLAGLVRLAWDLGAHWQQLRSAGGVRFWLLLALRAAGLAGGLWALSLAVVGESRRADGRGHGLPWGSLLQAAAGILLTAFAVASLVQLVGGPEADRFVVRSAYRSALLLAASLWLVRRPSSSPGRASRVAGALAVNLLVALVLLEGVALSFASLNPTRLLWNEESARDAILANRLEPGFEYLGFRANSGGYYDEEFYRAGAGDFVVAVVADSFGVGVVPHRNNFTTIVEQRLRRRLPPTMRVAVHNFGVVSIGLPEYSWLVQHEVPATSPDRIVLGLFVGNDLSVLASRRRHGYYSLQQLQLFELGRRLVLLGRDSHRRARVTGTGRGRRIRPVAPSGTFDDETFLRIELAAFELCNTRSGRMARLYESAFAWLGRLQSQVGDELLLVLIPDEYQVNDELFDELRRRVAAPEDYERFHPQERLLRFCRSQGIEVLDLLPPLRQANLERPVYKLRDTHWNELGNRVAGEAIASHLLATAPE